MVIEKRKQGRTQAVRELKRNLILAAARKVFEADGLDGASLRAIAAEAGYTPAALYFHFDSKEAIYAEVLRDSLTRLGEAVEQAFSRAKTPVEQIHAAAIAFFRFYDENPRDLDLGFYLFRGGMSPKGLGRDRDQELNTSLQAALHPIAEAALQIGAKADEANLLMVDIFAHAAGLLLLAHTGRIRMFEVSAPDRMEAYIRDRVEWLQRTGNESEYPTRRDAGC
jgi:AcrR family transcriptional regulator